MDENTGKFISESTAMARQEAYFDFVKSGKFPTDPTAPACPVGFFFGVNKIRELMKLLSEQPDIIGIRLLMGRNGDLPDAFMVGVDKDGNDHYLTSLSRGTAPQDGGGILGDPKPCPNYCD